MERIALIGNAGGGKSTLARALATRRGLPYVEIDALLWRDGWLPAPEDGYEAEHARLIAGPRWVIDGLGRLESLAARLARASEIVLVDLPLWMHFWLAAERQIAWTKGDIAHPPAAQRRCRRPRICSEPSSRSIATGCRRCVGWWPCGGRQRHACRTHRGHRVTRSRCGTLIPETRSPGARPGDRGCYRGSISPGCPRRGARCR